MRWAARSRSFARRRRRFSVWSSTDRVSSGGYSTDKRDPKVAYRAPAPIAVLDLNGARTAHRTAQRRVAWRDRTAHRTACTKEPGGARIDGERAGEGGADAHRIRCSTGSRAWSSVRRSAGCRCTSARSGSSATCSLASRRVISRCGTARRLLGVAWVVLQPLLAAGAFSFVFGTIAGLSSDGVPYFAFAFAGMLAWNTFSSAVTRMSGSLVGNAASDLEDLLSRGSCSRCRCSARCSSTSSSRP